MEQERELLNTTVGLFAGFLLGLMTWAIEHRVERRELRQNVHALLRQEYEHNLNKLHDFWNIVTVNVADQHDIEKFHRLAAKPLPEWMRLMWTTNAGKLADALDSDEIGRAIALNDRLDEFMRLRNTIRTVLMSDYAQDVWRDFIRWRTLRNSDNVNDRERATHQASEVLGRCSELLRPLMQDWNDLCAVYEGIKKLDNPIPTRNTRMPRYAGLSRRWKSAPKE